VSGRIIVAELHEHGGNRSLFGEDENGQPIRARRVEESDSDAELRRSAAGSGASSTAFKSREQLVRDIGDAITVGDHERARSLHKELELLDGYDLEDDPEEREGKHERDIGFRQGEGGGDGETHSRESREEWLRRLRGQRPLREERAAERRATYWMARLRGS
jgi:hypothetical protein